MSAPVGLISPSVYSQSFNPYVWNSYNTLSPYHHGSVPIQISSPEVVKILLGRPEFGDTIAIHGPKRTGKSLLATFIIVERLKESMDIYGDYIEKVLTNAVMDFSSIGMEDKYELFTDIEQIKALPSGSLLYLDEIRRFTDSYISQSQQNRLVSNLLADTGKQKNDFYYTDQSMMGPPGRVRVNIDYVLSPIFDPYTTWVRGKEPGIVKTYVFDSLNSFYQFFNPMIPGQPMTRPIFQFAFYAPPFYKFYKTGQKVEDWHFKFKPKLFVEDLINWRNKNWPNAPFSKKLVKHWDTVTGQDLSAPEREAVLMHMELSGMLTEPTSEDPGNEFA